jgi:hypothetical protein
MDTQSGAHANEAARTVEFELELIRDAIAMVASGGSRRVVVAGLRIGEPLLEPARLMARDSAVRIEPLWSADESSLDIAVERIAG